MSPALSESEIRGLSGVTAVVTGASSGIGLEVVRGLASRGAHVVLAVRSLERGQAAASAIRSTTPGASLDVMALDLADLASVHRFAEALSLRMRALDLLINNAAVGTASLQHTMDGFELVFGTNHLGHFALTGLLLPILMAYPLTRVVTVSSMAHAMSHIDFDNLDGSKGYAETRAYAQSKLANLLFAYEFQRRLTSAQRTQLSVACHPGWAATSLAAGPREQLRLHQRLLHWLTMRIAPSPAKAARYVLYAATAPDVTGGDYIGPSGRFGVSGSPARVRSSVESHDLAVARQLWEVSERMTGVHYAFGSGVLVLPSLNSPHATSVSKTTSGTSERNETTTPGVPNAGSGGMSAVAPRTNPT